MNRTDRLYAIVECLRAQAPRARTAHALAERFEVSVRTIERDLLALQEAGVPIWATRGPGGGYSLDPSMTLPPLKLTPEEAAAVAVALHAVVALPLPSAGRSALQKLITAMSPAGRQSTRSLVERIYVLPEESIVDERVIAAIETALTNSRLLAIDYEDASGNRTTGRPVEPVGLLSSERGWYLLGWCRHRNAVRFFRFDRILEARVTDEQVTPRAVEDLALDLAGSTRPTLA